MPQYMIQRDNFNPRSREGSDNLAARASGLPVISIHAPAKGATFFFLPILAHSSISIHAPAKGATAGRGRAGSRCSDFNPRSREGSDYSSLPSRYVVCDFNPRSREGSDYQRNPLYVSPKISIHAPAKGATMAYIKLCRHSGFQSTLPRRERPDHILRKESEKRISIHAPAKGATGNGVRNLYRRGISIHAPAKGATKKDAVDIMGD